MTAQQKLPGRRRAAKPSRNRQDLTFSQNCEHLTYGFNSRALRPFFARIAFYHQLLDVAVSAGEMFQVICAAIAAGKAQRSSSS